MMNAHLPAVLLLLENMTLSESEAVQVQSAVQVAAVAPSTSTFTLPTSTKPESNISVEISDLTLNADADNVPSDNTPSPENPPGATANPATIPSRAPQAILLQLLRDLPVTSFLVDGNVRFQKTYNNFAFDVPQADAAGPFYLVTRGRRVSIFSTWQCTSPHVLGVSLASHSRVVSMDAGLLGVADAIKSNEAHVVV